MPVIKMHVDAEVSWPELMGTLDSAHLGEIKELGYLKGGMKSGAPSITLLCEMEDGSKILVQTSAKLFVTAAAGVKGWCERDGVDV